MESGNGSSAMGPVVVGACLAGGGCCGPKGQVAIDTVCTILCVRSGEEDIALLFIIFR